MWSSQNRGQNIVWNHHAINDPRLVSLFNTMAEAPVILLTVLIRKVPCQVDTRPYLTQLVEQIWEICSSNSCLFPYKSTYVYIYIYEQI